MRYSIGILLAGLVLLSPALSIIGLHWGEPVAWAAGASATFAFSPFVAFAFAPRMVRDLFNADHEGH